MEAPFTDRKLLRALASQSLVQARLHSQSRAAAKHDVWTCLNLPSGKDWCCHLGSFRYPLFYAYGWKDTTDKTAQGDLYVSFDAVQLKNSVQGTWILFEKNFFAYNIPWPTFGGMLSDDGLVGCLAVRMVVTSATKNNSLSMQITGI